MLKLRGYFITLGILGVAMLTLALTDGWERFPDLFYRPDLHDRIWDSADIQRAALSDRDLVILTEGGDLWSLDEKAGVARKEPLFQHVLDLCVQDGAPTVITASASPPELWTVRTREGPAWSIGRTVQSNNEGFVGMLCEEHGLVILTSSRILRLGHDGTMESRRLTQRIPAMAVSTLQPLEGDLVVSANIGEFGGGVHRINRRTGKVTPIEQTPRLEPCDGLLSPECDPVPSVTPIPWKPGCIAILVGQVYDPKRNAVLESCGSEVKRIHTSPCLPAAQTEEGWLCRSTGLAVLDDRLVLTGSHEPVWLDSKGDAETRALPAFRKIGPFELRSEPTRILLDRSARSDLALIVIERAPTVAAQGQQARRPAT